MNASVELAVLGPLEVRVDGVPVAVGGRTRALLAALALQPGVEVAPDRLVELVWPDGAPAGDRNALQALVSRARRALGVGAGILATGQRGYTLQVAPDALDTGRLEAAVVEARRAPLPAVDVAHLADALSRWRGDPFVEVADDPDALAVAARLSELRSEGAELHAEARLAQGDGGDGVVADLRPIAEAAPTRERTHRLLARALYRCGRQTDALAVVGSLSERLRDELGLDPDPRTTALHAALLRHDLAAIETLEVVGGRGSTGGNESPGGDGGDDGTRTVDGPVARGAGPRPLPRPRTSFVGRDEQRRDLLRLLADGVRLVTLVGPGGTGKTRLAIETAATLDPRPRDGAAFVDLAPLTDPSDVLAEVASAVGLEGPASGAGPAGRTIDERSVADRLRDRLRQAHLLVLVDNCEHVIDAAAAAVELVLDAGPGVQVVATSREGLRVDGEHLWSVPPLDVAGAAAPNGSEDVGADPNRLLAFDATRLFVQRARAADPSFELDAETAPAVAELCRRLDGLPLGIELAAARVATLPVTTLAERLEDRFRLLTGGRRTVRRQETLAAVVAWSYDLLDDRQRRVFRRLGVFSGEVAVELAEAVLAADDLPVHDILPTLTELAERSLVVLTGTDGRGPGVRMLETIRAYAQARLVSDDDVAGVRTRHAEVMAERAAAASLALRGHDQLNAFRQLDEEIDEHRAAAAWSLATEPVRAVQVSAQLAWFAWLRDRDEEAARWLQRSLDAAGDATPAADAALAWSWLSFLLSFRHDQTDAEHAAERARAALREAGETAPPFTQVGVALIDAFVRAFGVGDPSTVVPDLEATVELAATLDEAWVVAAGHYVLGTILSAAGDRERARHELERSLDAAGACGDRWVAFQTRQQLALELTVDGDYAAAAAHLDRAIPLGEAIGAYGHARTTRIHRAVADIHTGDLTSADARLREVFAAGGEGGAAGAYALHTLSLVRRRQGEPAAAVDVARRAEAGYLAVDERAGALVACVGESHAWLELGEVTQARSALDRAIVHASSGLPVMVLGAAVPYLLETDAAVVLAEQVGRSGAHRAAERLGRAARLRADLGRPLIGAERVEVDRAEAAVVALLGEPATSEAMAAGRDRTGLLPPLD